VDAAPVAAAPVAAAPVAAAPVAAAPVAAAPVVAADGAAAALLYSFFCSCLLLSFSLLFSLGGLFLLRLREVAAAEEGAVDDRCTQPANSQLIPQSMMKYLGSARLAWLSRVS